MHGMTFVIGIAKVKISWNVKATDAFAAAFLGQGKHVLFFWWKEK